jgi:hypothetical protein
VKTENVAYRAMNVDEFTVYYKNTFLVSTGVRIIPCGFKGRTRDHAS